MRTLRPRVVGGSVGLDLFPDLVGFSAGGDLGLLPLGVTVALLRVLRVEVDVLLPERRMISYMISSVMARRM
jgi:hypothetical protein